jgi:hypothetical protein
MLRREFIELIGGASICAVLHEKPLLKERD